MLERENWPYFLVVCLGVLSWVANDFVKSAREIAILTLDTQVSTRSDKVSEYSVEITNLSKTKFADSFKVSLLTKGTTSFIIRADNSCAGANYTSKLRDQGEENITCSSREINVPIVRLPPASSVSITVETAGRASQSAIQTKIFTKQTNTTFSILSQFDVTAIFLRFEWLILAALAMTSLWTLVRSILRAKDARLDAKREPTQKLSELLRVANTAQIRLGKVKSSTGLAAIKSDIDVIQSGLRDLQMHLQDKEEPKL